MKEIIYLTPDEGITASEFLALAERVWPGDYDSVATANALDRTINITARDNVNLVGVVRVLTDGYFFGTVPELLVDPEHRGSGVGRRLMELAWEASPTSLYFGAQPGKEGFYEALGYERGLQSYYRKKLRNQPN